MAERAPEEFDRVSPNDKIQGVVFQGVGIDFVGPLPKTVRGNKYVVTLVDYFSKWPEAALEEDQSSSSQSTGCCLWSDNEL